MNGLECAPPWWGGGSKQQPGLMFELMGGYFWRLWELPIFAVVGALGGLAGALLVVVQEHLAVFRHKFIPASKSWRRVFEVMAMAFSHASHRPLEIHIEIPLMASGTQHTAHLPQRQTCR